MKAGILHGDPLYRFNELEWKWVALEDWTFEGTFECAADDCERFSVLRMDGVDTVASISLNGHSIGSVASAFLRHELAVGDGMLHTGTNTITIAIQSALRYAKQQSAAYPYTVPHTQYYHVWSEPSHRNFVRKPACVARSRTTSVPSPPVHAFC